VGYGLSKDSLPLIRLGAEYAVLRKLGEVGIVYKAMDTALNRIVAIKMLKSAMTTDEVYFLFI